MISKLINRASFVLHVSQYLFQNNFSTGNYILCNGNIFYDSAPALCELLSSVIAIVCFFLHLVRLCYETFCKLKLSCACYFSIYNTSMGQHKRRAQIYAVAVTLAIQYNTIQYNTIQYNTIQCNAMQYNTIQYNTIQYNSIQLKGHSTEACLVNYAF